MNNNKNKGFTLIELLVVIAIIGILASVVLASLNSARSKGADAAVKSNLNNMRAQAELFYSDQTPNSYKGSGSNPATVCADPNMSKMEAAAKSAGDGVGFCSTKTDGSAWAAWAHLKSKNTKGWCVDSTGVSKLVGADAVPAATLPTAAITVCP